MKGANNNVILIHGNVRVNDDWTAAFRRLETIFLREHQRLRWTIEGIGLIVIVLLAILLVYVVFRCSSAIRQRRQQPIELNSSSSSCIGNVALK